MNDKNKNSNGKMPGSGQVFATILIAGLITLAVVMWMSSFWGNKARVPYSDFVQLVEAGRVESAEVDSSQIYFKLKKDSSNKGLFLDELVTIRMESGDQLTQRLLANGVKSEQVHQSHLEYCQLCADVRMSGIFHEFYDAAHGWRRHGCRQKYGEDVYAEGNRSYV